MNMLKACIACERDHVIADTDDRLFGSFIEHVGRAVYGGIFEPTHPCANEFGFRTDVMELIRQLQVSVIRYPGGNFVSGYDWEDGVGPVDARPTRLDLAWNSLETNRFGTDEFCKFAQQVNASPMMAVNLGTKGMEQAAALVEYCNIGAGTARSDARIANGAKKPHDIRLWCLGNEPDGSWQIGHKSAKEYGRAAVETGKVMKWVDPTIELVACGSSNSKMSTFSAWEKTVLEHVYEIADYISLHTYYGNRAADTPDFLANSLDMDRMIHTVVGICDLVKSKKHSKKTMYLSFDEYNVWYHSDPDQSKIKPWCIAPPRLQDTYTLEDAICVGLLLITLIKHADRVKIACLAQLVNAIAPIMTKDNGPAWRQTIFYPFYHASVLARGTVMHTEVDVAAYDSKNFCDVPYADAVTVLSIDQQRLTTLVVNRHISQKMVLTTRFKGLKSYKPKWHYWLCHEDSKACNTEQTPNRVTPRKRCLDDDASMQNTLVLPALSWNVLVYEKEKE